MKILIASLVLFLSSVVRSNEFDSCTIPGSKGVKIEDPSVLEKRWGILLFLKRGHFLGELLNGGAAANLTCPWVDFKVTDAGLDMTLTGTFDGVEKSTTLEGTYSKEYDFAVDFHAQLGGNDQILEIIFLGTDEKNWAVMAACAPGYDPLGLWVFVSKDNPESVFDILNEVTELLENAGIKQDDVGFAKCSG